MFAGFSCNHKHGILRVWLYGGHTGSDEEINDVNSSIFLICMILNPVFQEAGGNGYLVEIVRCRRETRRKSKPQSACVEKPAGSTTKGNKIC
jgi:hypothetical protein